MAAMISGPQHDEPSIERARETLVAGQKVRTRLYTSD